MTRNNLIIKLLIAIQCIFIPLKLIASDSDESLAITSQAIRGKTNFSVIAKGSPFSAGLEADYRWNSQSAIGLFAEVEHWQYIINYGGIYYKKYVGNSFFIQPSIGISQLFSTTERISFNSAAASIIIGNEWVFSNGLSLGADWGGVLAVANIIFGGGSFLFQLPNLRIGYSF